MVDQRAEAVGPHVGGDLPVAQAAVVVAAAPEPAVVEHEALDPDRRGGVGQPLQVVEVGVEVDGLPGVEHERPRARAVAGLCPLVPHQRAGQPVEPVGGVHEDDGRRGVGLAGRQPHLPRRQRLTATEHRRVRAGTLGQPLDEVLVVAAPGDVRGPHLAGPEAEAGRADDHQQGRVVTGAPPPAGAQPGAVGQRMPLRRPLAAPATGEVEHLAGAGGQRQHSPQGRHVEGRRVVGGVRERRLDDEHAVLVEPVAQDQLHPHVGCRARAPPRPRHRRARSPPSGGRCDRRRGARHTPACRASPLPRWAARSAATARRGRCAARPAW